MHEVPIGPWIGGLPTEPQAMQLTERCALVRRQSFDVPGEGAAALAASENLRALGTLDLAGNVISDEDLRALEALSLARSIAMPELSLQREP